MANYFKESEDLPILSSWITQGFVIDKPYILEAIETDRNALEKDTQLSTVATFGSIASGCLMLALGGITAPMIIPIAMIGAAGLTAWNSDCAKSDRELEAKFLRAYPTVFDRLAQRIGEGETVSRIASDYGLLLKAYRRADRTALASLVDANAQTIAPAAAVTVVDNMPIAALPSDHSADAGNMVKVDTPIALAVDTPIAVAPNIQHIVSPVWNPAKDLGENPQSALIVGTPGSGKGVTVSNAVRVLKSQNPTLTVMMIDPKGDENEAGYWQPVTDIFESFALMDCLDPDEGAAWLLSCMSKFQKLPAPKLLIFDELLAASIELEMADKSMKALPKLKKFMAGIVAQGDSKGVWVWAMSQSPQCSDLGLNGGVRGNLRIIAIVSPKNKTAIQVITSTKLVPMVEGGMDELDKIMTASPVGRAVFDGKIARWLPMPKLENHSAIDRDNRSLSSTTPIAIPSPSDITGTWREEFAKNLPPGLSESDFKARYDLEKSLREPWQAVEPIEVETIAVVETNSRSSYDDWNEYPVHQAVLVYLQGKADKTDRNVYDSIKKKVDSEQWESIPGTDNMAKLKNVLSYLTNTKKVIKVSPNSYSAVD